MGNALNICDEAKRRSAGAECEAGGRGTHNVWGSFRWRRRSASWLGRSERLSRAKKIKGTTFFKHHFSYDEVAARFDNRKHAKIYG